MHYYIPIYVSTNANIRHMHTHGLLMHVYVYVKHGTESTLYQWCRHITSLHNEIHKRLRANSFWENTPYWSLLLSITSTVTLTSIHRLTWHIISVCVCVCVYSINVVSAKRAMQTAPGCDLAAELLFKWIWILCLIHVSHSVPCSQLV